MRKSDIRVGLGMKIMERRRELTAAGCGDLLKKFFKGCRTTAEMEHRIKINGGYDCSADALAATPNRIWRTT